jgi:hypothetical protein
MYVSRILRYKPNLEYIHFLNNECSRLMNESNRSQFHFFYITNLLKIKDELIDIKNTISIINNEEDKDLLISKIDKIKTNLDTMKLSLLKDC